MLSFSRSLAVLTAAVVLAACTNAAGEDPGPRVVQPGAPGESSRTVSADEAPMVEVPQHTDADVRFMQMMITHHAQALEMTSLVAERTEREDIPLFAKRIEVTQADEIELMQDWLERRGEEVPEASADPAQHGGELMPGMLTEEELAELEAASGEKFDRLFLERMHFHHMGALQMVEELYETEGAGEEPEIFQFAGHVDSDQKIEISRIEQMLAEMEADQDD